MKTLSINYTNVCWFCGAIYGSNRWSSKYCSPNHNSMYSLYGPQIPQFTNNDGIAIDISALDDIYSEMDITVDGWSVAFPHGTIRNEFNYKGSLPVGEEFLLVGDFIIQMFANQSMLGEDLYSVKPFTKLTREEKIPGSIVDGKTGFFPMINFVHKYPG